MKFTLNGVYVCEFADGFRVKRLDNCPFIVELLTSKASIDKWAEVFISQNAYSNRREAIEAGMKLLRFGETISFLPKQFFSLQEKIAS